MLSGQPVKVAGIIKYNFLGENVLLSAVRLSDKLHPQIETLLRKPDRRGGFSGAGKVTVALWLTARTPETMAALQQLGFVVKHESPYSRIIIGFIPAEHLAVMIEMDAVRYVAPWLLGS